MIFFFFFFFFAEDIEFGDENRTRVKSKMELGGIL
jgi:hypothetical protein